MMMVWIDGDGCPVVLEAVKICSELSVKVTILCDTSHRIEIDGAQTITVSKGQDSVDFAIVNRISPCDIVVTQDYGLAAMILARGGKVITQNGMEIDNNNIDSLLSIRYLSKKARDSGVRMKGPSKRTCEQNAEFKRNFRMILQGAENGD